MVIKKNIPNFITLLNLATGFVAILLNDPLISPFLILTASFLDMADGLLARFLKAKSALGEQLDSLSDLVSFGIAPAYLYYWHMMEEGWVSILLISLFPVFAALRLGIFNTKSSESEAFSGLPSPASGILLSFLVYSHHSDQLTGPYQWLILITPALIAILMVSPIRTMSLKQINNKDRFEQMLIFLLGLGVVVFLVLFKFMGIYFSVILYLILSLVYLIRRKNNAS
jgi:CDP-diacylglycerol--serine O-phosphatidyltransferase